MADPSRDQSWRTPPFRKKIMVQIDEAIRQSGNPTNRNSAEMENHVFNKAKSKDEYLSFVARLILHVREMNSSTKQGGAQQGPPGMPPISNSPNTVNPDPINALQTMARQVVGGQRMQMANQMNMNKAGMKVQSQLMAMQQHHQQQQQQQQQQTMLPPNKPGTPLGQMQPMMTSDGLMMTSRDSGTPSGMNYSSSQQQQQQQNQQQQQQRQPTPNQFLNQHQVVGTHQMVPSPVHQMPTSLSSSQMAPSPVPYLPSHSPQIVPSPASMSSHGGGGQTPGRQSTMGGAPSPGSALNTPMSLSGIQSPANRIQEDQAYLEKLKQLQKYIEPLRRLIARLDKEDNVDKKKELVKMKNLFDSLSNPNKRLQMDTLLKCEQVLEKLELAKEAHSVGSGSGSVPTIPQITQLSQSKEYNLCQPLYEAIIAHMNLPTFNHTMQRTFGPAVSALLGEPVRYNNNNGSGNINNKKRKRRGEEDEFDIPDVLQGEIARLDRRFKVNINPIQHRGSKTVHLLCQLDDKNLPCVPPIMLTVPDCYPQQSPQCETDAEEYVSTEFLQTVHKNLITRLSKMAEQFSITTLLDTWEMSVRQACAPNTTQIHH
ncbi:mediator complex subunit Med15 [Chamberlinius hualienensis]